MTPTPHPGNHKLSARSQHNFFLVCKSGLSPAGKGCLPPFVCLSIHGGGERESYLKGTPLCLFWVLSLLVKNKQTEGGGAMTPALMQRDSGKISLRNMALGLPRDRPGVHQQVSRNPMAARWSFPLSQQINCNNKSQFLKNHFFQGLCFYARRYLERRQLHDFDEQPFLLGS